MQKDDLILDEFKFEEDITPKFMSKYSASAEFKTNQRPKFYTVRDLLMLTPPLNDLGISPTEALTKVNEFEVKEISYDLGTIKFDDDSGKAEGTASAYGICQANPQ